MVATKRFRRTVSRCEIQGLAGRRAPAETQEQTIRGGEMTAQTEEVDPAVSEVLRAVYDPCCRDKGISVVDMGLLHRASISDGVARVDLLLTSGWCPFAASVLTDIEDAVAAMPGVEQACVRIVWDEVWGPDRLTDGARAKLRFLPPPREAGEASAYVATNWPGTENLEES
jgi:metal-sulfur cluster biosynthetic enzyme